MATDPATQIIQECLATQQRNVRQQLDILRKTRGQREVGTVKIPAHLQQPTIILDDSGVEERADIPQGK
jgi:hypothetical protein